MNFNYVVQIAKINLEKDGHCLPIAILYKKKQKGKDDVFFCPLIFDGYKEKEKMRKAVRKIVIEKDIDKYWLVMESWVSKNVHVSLPSRDSGRTEALVISEYSKENPNGSMIVLNFSRKGKKIIWGDKQTTNNKEDSINLWNFYHEEISDDELQTVHKKDRIKDIVERIKEADFEDDYKKYLEAMMDTIPELKKEIVGGLDISYDSFKQFLILLAEKGIYSFPNGNIPDFLKREDEK